MDEYGMERHDFVLALKEAISIFGGERLSFAEPDCRADEEEINYGIGRYNRVRVVFGAADSRVRLLEMYKGPGRVSYIRGDIADYRIDRDKPKLSFIGKNGEVASMRIAKPETPQRAPEDEEPESLAHYMESGAFLRDIRKAREREKFFKGGK